MHHGTKDRSASLAALKIIVQKRVNEKSHLEEQKTNLLSNLTAKISQIDKVHKNAIEAQRVEIEKQYKQFQFEIEMLKKRILELEKKKRGQYRDGHIRAIDWHQNKVTYKAGQPKPQPKKILLQA